MGPRNKSALLRLCPQQIIRRFIAVVVSHNIVYVASGGWVECNYAPGGPFYVKLTENAISL